MGVLWAVTLGKKTELRFLMVYTTVCQQNIYSLKREKGRKPQTIQHTEKLKKDVDSQADDETKTDRRQIKTQKTNSYSCPIHPARRGDTTLKYIQSMISELVTLPSSVMIF